MSVDARPPRGPSRCLRGSLQAWAGSPKEGPSRVGCSGGAGREWDHTCWMTRPRIPQADPQEHLLSLPLSACPDPWVAAAASPKPRRTHLGPLQPKLWMSPHTVPWRLRRAWLTGVGKAQCPGLGSSCPLSGHSEDKTARIITSVSGRGGSPGLEECGGLGGELRAVSQADLSRAPGPGPLPQVACWAQENPPIGAHNCPLHLLPPGDTSP